MLRLEGEGGGEEWKRGEEGGGRKRGEYGTEGIKLQDSYSRLLREK